MQLFILLVRYKVLTFICAIGYKVSMLSKASKALRREQFDRSLAQSPGLRRFIAPKRGWIREVREILGLSAQQLATRMGVSQPTVAKMEQAEAKGVITLASLKRAAEAMDCQLVYTFVPRSSFEEILQVRASEVAARLLDRVGHTMSLEAQEPGGDFRARRERELADELVRTLSRELWEEGMAPKALRDKAE